MNVLVRAEDDSEDEGLENRQEQIVAAPLKSGPASRDTCIDVLRLRRAGQLDSALPRSESWARQYVDEEDARRELESALKNGTRKNMSPPNSKGGAPQRQPHPPALRQNTAKSANPRTSFVQVSPFPRECDAIPLCLSLVYHANTSWWPDAHVHQVGAVNGNKHPHDKVETETQDPVTSSRSAALSKGSVGSADMSEYPTHERRAHAHATDEQTGAAQQTKKSEEQREDVEIETNPLKYVPKTHPVHKIVKRLLNKSKLSALHAWLSWHSGHMHKKQRIIDQYVTCCAKMKPKRSPFLRNQLRCWLFKPSAGKLDLVSSGMTSRDVSAILCALAGVGCGLNADRAVSIVEICDEFGDYSLESIDLSRNDIGGEGMRHVADVLVASNFFRLKTLWRVPSISTAVRTAGCITWLDLSRNSLGSSSAKHIKNLLSNEACSIQTMILAGNNLHDMGCATIISALIEQDSLKHLDLSENGASSAAGFALGNMLPTNDTLLHLDLNFNSLRGGGARSACLGLAQNSTLEVLMLQWNGMGDEDTMDALARALATCVLKILNLADNRIKLRGASILAATMELGTCLEHLDLDGNKIGQIGARAILSAVQAAAGDGDFKTSVSTNNCGANMVDKLAFDPGETAGKYELDLRESYSRSVLIKLIRTSIQAKGAFSPIRLGDKVLNFCVTLGDSMQGNIVHNNSIEVADWHILTSRGHKLPIAQEQDQNAQLSPLEAVWAKVLGKKVENVTLKVKFAYASLRKRASAADSLPEKSFLVLSEVFFTPLSLCLSFSLLLSHFLFSLSLSVRYCGSLSLSLSVSLSYSHARSLSCSLTLSLVF